MNRNRMLVLAVIALILSAGVTYFAYRLLKTRLQPVDQSTQVVVAAEKLPIGTRLTAKNMKLTPWPTSVPLEGSYRDPAQLIGRAVLAEVFANEPILDSRLAPTEAGAGLAVAIPEGMRALSIQVNSVIGVTGFVSPGSRVDLILTGVPPKHLAGKVQGGGREDEMGSKIVLENLQVLATGQNVQRDVDGKPQSVQEVTLLVTPEQAEKIALATGDGRIQLALRNPLDSKEVSPPLVLRSALYEGAVLQNRASAEKAPPAAPRVTEKKPVAKVIPASAPEKAPAPRVVAVELIQGTRRATQTFEEKQVPPPADESKP